MMRKKGYTLVEMIFVVIFIGILAAMALPKINFAIVRKQKADTVSRKIVTDLRRARRLAITEAANNTIGYELEMVGLSPYASYQIDNLDPPEATIDTHTIDAEVECTGDTNFKFGPLGNLLGGSGSTLNIAAEGKSYTITVTSSTGMVKCVED